MSGSIGRLTYTPFCLKSSFRGRLTGAIAVLSVDGVLGFDGGSDSGFALLPGSLAVAPRDNQPRRGLLYRVQGAAWQL